MQGDVVAIEMLPESEWSCPSSMIIEDEEEKEDDDAMKEVEYITLILYYFITYSSGRSYYMYFY